ncbi:HNH endonuclease signature motif containing protein [Sulfitobacter porphyrae]|uniref:HNH endonuclease signature motif containing protein n=1 Tax=Sulfitobacter porphyrae TaxID=1246864 RepID=A0ABW2B4V1_9RHOB
MLALARGLDSYGYGRLRIAPSRAQYRAHRISYRIAFGKDPGELYVCHKCDNPQCCNPSHMFLGTAADNNADKIAKGRTRSGDHTGANNGNAKLTEAMARRAVELIQAGKTNVAIGRELAVGHSLISRIRVGRSWRDLSLSMGYEPKASKQSPKSGRTKCKLRAPPVRPPDQRRDQTAPISLGPLISATVAEAEHA